MQKRPRKKRETTRSRSTTCMLLGDHKQNDCSDTGFVCENYVRFVYMSNMSDLQAVTLSDMRCETSKDVMLSKLLAQIKNGKWSRDTDLEPYSRIKDELSIFEGVILRGNRIVVPQSLRKQILSLAHEMHQGIVKTKQFLRTRFFWPGMDDPTEEMIKNCQACVVNEPLNKYTPLQPTPLPRGPWVKGAVDLVGPADGKFILTYTDYYSSYPEAYILKEITSREVIKALTDIFARFGFPEELVSDNGKQFISEEFEAFLKWCGIRHIRVSPYYAWSNRKLERFHRYWKKIFERWSLKASPGKRNYRKFLWLIAQVHIKLVENRLVCCCWITKFVRRYCTLSLTQIQQHRHLIVTINQNVACIKRNWKTIMCQQATCIPT